jgi:hypothetical protein
VYRTYAYIDGFTLTKRLMNGRFGRSSPPFAKPARCHCTEVTKRTQLFDLGALVTPFIPLDHTVMAIRYYASTVSIAPGDGHLPDVLPESPLRRHTYFGSQTSVIVQIPSPAADPDEYEGERDVPLVVHLLRDGARDAYDVAIVITDDVALAEPIEIITRRLRKRVGLLWPSVRNSGPLARVSSFTRYLSDAHLRVARLSCCGSV